MLKNNMGGWSPSASAASVGGIELNRCVSDHSYCMVGSIYFDRFLRRSEAEVEVGGQTNGHGQIARLSGEVFDLARPPKGRDETSYLVRCFAASSRNTTGISRSVRD